MLRAPTWSTSAYSATRATCSGAITSVTTASPVWSRASATGCKPFSFIPSQLYALAPAIDPPPAEPVAARLLPDVGGLQDLVAALHRARPGDDADVAAADLEAERRDDGRLLLHLGAGHLVRCQDRDHFLHPLAGFQGLFG